MHPRAHSVPHEPLWSGNLLLSLYVLRGLLLEVLQVIKGFFQPANCLPCRGRYGVLPLFTEASF